MALEDSSFATSLPRTDSSLLENQSTEARDTGIEAILLLIGACWVGEQSNGGDS